MDSESDLLRVRLILILAERDLLTEWLCDMLSDRDFVRLRLMLPLFDRLRLTL